MLPPTFLASAQLYNPYSFRLTSAPPSTYWHHHEGRSRSQGASSSYLPAAPIAPFPAKHSPSRLACSSTPTLPSADASVEQTEREWQQMFDFLDDPWADTSLRDVISGLKQVMQLASSHSEQCGANAVTRGASRDTYSRSSRLWLLPGSCRVCSLCASISYVASLNNMTLTT